MAHILIEWNNIQAEISTASFLIFQYNIYEANRAFNDLPLATWSIPLLIYGMIVVTPDQYKCQGVDWKYM